MNLIETRVFISQGPVKDQSRINRLYMNSNYIFIIIKKKNNYNFEYTHNDCKCKDESEVLESPAVQAESRLNSDYRTGHRSKGRSPGSREYGRRTTALSGLTLLAEIGPTYVKS